MLHATLSTWEVEKEGSRPIKAFKKGSTPSVKKNYSETRVGHRRVRSGSHECSSYWNISTDNILFVIQHKK